MYIIKCVSVDLSIPSNHSLFGSTLYWPELVCRALYSVYLKWRCGAPGMGLFDSTCLPLCVVSL